MTYNPSPRITTKNTYFVRMHLKINVGTLNVQILFGSQTQS